MKNNAFLQRKKNGIFFFYKTNIIKKKFIPWRIIVFIKRKEKNHILQIKDMLDDIEQYGFE